MNIFNFPVLNREFSPITFYGTCLLMIIHVILLFFYLFLEIVGIEEGKMFNGLISIQVTDYILLHSIPIFLSFQSLFSLAILFQMKQIRIIGICTIILSLIEYSVLSIVSAEFHSSMNYQWNNELFFIGILVLVGVDVGMNITFPKYLTDAFSMDVDKAGMGNSVYFFARTVGSFLGGVLLMKYAEKNFFITSVFLGVAGLVLMLAVKELWAAYAGVVLFGLGYSNLFGIIMANAIKYRPEKSNEISALLVMGISGGGVLPPLMGIITDATGTQWAALLIIAAVWLYLFWLIGKMYLRKSL